MFDQPVNRSDEICVMYPRNVLLSVARRAAETASDESEHNIENAARVGAQRDRRAHQYFSRIRRVGFVCGFLPGLGDVNAESPRGGSVRLTSPDDASYVVIRFIESVSIDGGGA